eukprot:3692244-Ditylum_brightwellii.AAC.1
MHNKQQYRMAHYGFGNAMLLADMDKAISKGHLIMEINSMTKIPLPCSMDLLGSTTTSLESVFQMANDIVCHAAKKKKFKELRQ